MGIMKKNFASELSTIKSVFKSAYDKAIKLNESMSLEITNKEAEIKTLKDDIATIETVKEDNTKFIQNLEKLV